MGLQIIHCIHYLYLKAIVSSGKPISNCYIYSTMPVKRAAVRKIYLLPSLHNVCAGKY